MIVVDASSSFWGNNGAEPVLVFLIRKGVVDSSMLRCLPCNSRMTRHCSIEPQYTVPAETDRCCVPLDLPLFLLGVESKMVTQGAVFCGVCVCQDFMGSRSVLCFVGLDTLILSAPFTLCCPHPICVTLSYCEHAAHPP